MLEHHLPLEFLEALAWSPAASLPGSPVSTQIRMQNLARTLLASDGEAIARVLFCLCLRPALSKLYPPPKSQERSPPAGLWNQNPLPEILSKSEDGLEPFLAN